MASKSDCSEVEQVPATQPMALINDETKSDCSKMGEEGVTATQSKEELPVEISELNEEEIAKESLDTLPVEVLLHICQYLTPSTLLTSLALVSKHFDAVLSNEKTWEILVQKKWGIDFPPIPVSPESLPPTFHRISALKREQQSVLWTNPKSLNFRHHIACVDAVHLFKSNAFLATGSRDRTIGVVNLETAIALGQKGQGQSQVSLKGNAHAGWIWDFCMVGDQLVSASWDRAVKFWDLDNGGFTQTAAITFPSPALCLSSSENLICVGSFDSSIHLHDVRTAKKVLSYRRHRRSVLSIGMENNQIISAGEDNRLVLYDVGMRKAIGTISLPQPPQPPSTYPKSISFAKSGNYPLPCFYIGDIRGNVYLADLNKFEIVETYERVHEKAVQGIYATLGAVFSCGSDGRFVVHGTGRKLTRVHQLDVEKQEYTKVHCLNNRVALAGSDSVVRVFYN